MRKLTVFYTSQCPGNAAFIRTISEIAEPYHPDIEIIDVTTEPGKAEKLKDWGFSRTKNLFIRVFVGERLIETHPGNPQFINELRKALEENG